MQKEQCVLQMKRKRPSKIPVYSYDIDGNSYLRDSGYGTVSNVYDNRFRQNYYAVNVYTDYTRNFGLHNGKIMVGLNYERYDQDNLWGSGDKLTTTDKPFLSQAQENMRPETAIGTVQLPVTLLA